MPDFKVRATARDERGVERYTSMTVTDVDDERAAFDVFKRKFPRVLELHAVPHVIKDWKRKP